MDEVLEMIADSVSMLVVGLMDSQETGKLFANMVPASELIHSTVSAMCEAAKKPGASVDADIKVWAFENAWSWREN